MPSNDANNYYSRRKTALEQERQSFIPHYKDLTQFIKPRKGRYFISDRNKGDKRYSAIINSRATQAHRIATAGMLAGTMSPTRPWFALETHDPGLMERQAIKEWLYKVELVMRAVFNESNFYSSASNFLGELLLFGTSAMSHVDDFEDVARFYTHTAGSYFIGANARHEVDTLVREFEWTVGQIVEEFGIDKVSTAIKTKYDRGDYDKWFPICHFIEPNREHNDTDPTSKPYKSVYYEPHELGSDKKKYLRVKGFDEKPFYAPRWDVTGEDIYGTDCPAMTALGDIQQLQQEERRKSQAIDKLVNPPLTGPPSLKNQPVSSLPGGVNIYDPNGAQKLEALYQIQPQLGELRQDMNAIEQRIDEAFFVDLFLAVSRIEGIQPRNQLDLMQRNEERLLQLGPVLEHLQGEFLDPLIDRVFNQCLRADILPPIPQDLENKELKIKYISTLAIAQRSVATQSIEATAAFVGSLIDLGMDDAREKFDTQQAVDEYARAKGVPPTLIVPDEIVAQRRQERERQQQEIDALASAQEAASVAKTAADAKTDGKNALTDLVGT